MRATAQQWADAVSAACPFCREPAGRRCVKPGWGKQPATNPHKRRVRLAFAVRAHADPSLDEFWPSQGPCLLCGVPGLGARHRRIDAVAGHLAAGECEEEVADEMGVSVEAVLAVMAWAAKWPGAWQ